jgi:hypothetical protein
MNTARQAGLIRGFHWERAPRWGGGGVIDLISAAPKAICGFMVNSGPHAFIVTPILGALI